jgi:hypothetical protein
MKYLKLFENFNKSEIDDICNKYGITNYSINPNGSIDVDDSVYLVNMQLKEIPIKFNKVSGWFDCGNSELTTLENSPNYVGGVFNCAYNELTSLEGCPEEIHGDFYFHDNPITPIVYLFDGVMIYLDYQETYNFVRKDCKIVKHLLEEALKDFNEYYNKNIELPEEIEGYTYI